MIVFLFYYFYLVLLEFCSFFYIKNYILFWHVETLMNKIEYFRSLPVIMVFLVFEI
jgi:hypothetical protein